MKEKLFSRNEVVFREGDLGESFFQIMEGKAGVYLHYGEADERKLTEMKPGQYFGEMAVIGAWPRTATIVAEEDLRVTEITEAGLNEYFTEQPDRILAIMKQIGSRIRTLTEEYDEVTAFLKEKKDDGAEKKEGFLAKLKKYREISALAKKNAVRNTVEETVKVKIQDKPKASPLPVESCDKGQIIFREGESGTFMYAIHGGTVGIYTGYGSTLEKKLTTLYPNSFFGEMSLIDHERRSATAVAEENGTILEIISAENLQDLFKANPLEVDMILRHLSSRLKKLTIDYVKACDEAVQES
ncbi:cyclic nucleotide-binding domain-containing protein [Aristaeella lactis]|uniref:Cyclic nucleotide-binding domain-containing protein n=1 Tax=Aristaeella lactis TaxID=3046383 RepID=A0AC61PPK9_9FIRM|nr:cyclic nucleotide-binding domain-containing protein [Aristaeella lactis]QUA54460.1 cyclic nucleotide-binding domain-containing protein [Aristaeella lactis]SMC82830.1 Cyclic nucleotide-binding domain-containing protein [Aristaeella lactis]